MPNDFDEAQTFALIFFVILAAFILIPWFVERRRSTGGATRSLPRWVAAAPSPSGAKRAIRPTATATEPILQRSGRKKARSSSTNNAGSSSTGKWPPEGISDHRTTLYSRSAHGLGTRRTSRGKIAQPAGTSIRPSVDGVDARSWARSKYSREAEAIVPVTQYVVISASNSSRVKLDSTSPSQSL